MCQWLIYRKWGIEIGGGGGDDVVVVVGDGSWGGGDGYWVVAMLGGFIVATVPVVGLLIRLLEVIIG